MWPFSFGIFIMLHGLVHLWYVVLSQGLVPFEPEMGWTGESWILSTFLNDSTIRTLASIVFVLVTIGFIAAGIGIFARAEWWRSVLMVSAGVSVVAIMLFWDGNTRFLVQKGLLGLLIDVGILVAVLVLRWPIVSP